MLRPAVLLFLVLALTGQPLRQAEAANDFTRIQDRLLTPGCQLGIPDGGVGDDSGVAVMKAGSSHAGFACCPAPGEPSASVHSFFRSHLLDASPSGFVASRGHPAQGAWLPVGARQRQAWLQLLQF